MNSQPFPRSQVRPLNGAPALFINDEPVFPLLLMTGPRALKQLHELSPTGIHLITDVFPLGWNGVGQHDFSGFDALVADYVGADSAALLLPRIHLDAPDPWMDARLAELIGYADPRAWDGETCWGGPRHPSFASAIWRSDASQALRRLIAHIARSSYAHRIVGWHIGSGIYGEWHAWNGVYYPDTSAPFVREYENWRRANYPDDPAPRLPSVADRLQAECGVFRDPARRRWMLQHAEFFHQLGARTLSEFAGVVKEEAGRDSLVLAFNGYLPELGVNHEIDHRAFEATLCDPNLDAFAAPHSYARRKPGESGLSRGFTGSLRPRGKLWMDEGDERTHLAHQTPWKHVETRAQSLETLWRSFAHAVTQGSGLWFMDQGGLWFETESGSWYADAEILSALAQMKLIGAQSLERPRTRASEIAVVMNFKTAFYLADRASGLDHISDTLIIQQTEQIARCGAPFDSYLLPELFEPNVPPYKTYIFLDAFPYVRWAGLSILLPGEVTSARRLYDHEINYVLSGEGTLTIGEHECRATPDTCQFIAPRVTQTLRNPSSEPWTTIGVHFDWQHEADTEKFPHFRADDGQLPPTTRCFARRNLSRVGTRAQPNLDLRGRPLTRHFLEETVAAFTSWDENSRAQAGGLLWAAICQIEREVRLLDEGVDTSVVGPDAQRRLNDARWLLQQVEEEMPTVAQIAAHVNWSADYLGYMMRAAFGLTPRQYSSIVARDKTG